MPDEPVFSDADRAELGRQALELSKDPEPPKKEPTDEVDEQPAEVADDTEPESSEPGDDIGTEDSGDEPTPEERLKTALAAAEAGDGKALAKALGVTDSSLDTSSRKLRHVRKTLKEAKDLSNTTEATRQELREAYGDIREAQIRHKRGDVLGAVESIEKVFGAEFTDIVTEVLELQAGGGGAEGKALRVREAKIKEREDAFTSNQKKVQTQFQTAQAEKAAKGRVKVALQGHAYVQDDSDVEAVMQVVLKSYDETTRTYGLDVKEAADQLLAKEIARAAKRGGPTVAKVKPNARAKIRKLQASVAPKKNLGREKREDIFSEDDRARLGAEAARLSGGK